MTAAAGGAPAAPSASCVPAADEVVPVVPAGQRGAGDHRTGLGERQRLAAQVLDEVDGAEALVGVRGQAADQVAQRLAGAERPDRETPVPVSRDNAGHPRS